MKKWFLSFFVVVLLAFIFFFRVQLKDAVTQLTKPSLPQLKTAEEFVEKKSKAEIPAYQTDSKNSESGVQDFSADFPEEINLDIPFGSQAPFANWDLPYKETCEEASLIMAHYYFSGQRLDAKKMDEEILKLVDWEKKTFGYYEDTTAQEMAIILREYFGHKKVEVKYEFAIDDIKRAVAQGNPVIVPAAGRLLPNPNFRQPGPIYHALVIKGYTKDKIITNDPGTRKGADFLYNPDVLMNAIHDWNAQDILSGKKAMIIVQVEIF